MTTRVASMLITSLIVLFVGTTAVIASDWIPTYVLEVPDAQGDDFGWSIACAGFGEEDSYPYIIVGDPDYELGTGRVYIFSLYSGEIKDTIFARTDTDLFGWSVANLGDINGDGRDDIIIGSPGYSTTDGDIGATIYSGNGFSILRTIRTTDYSSVQNESYFGWDLSPVPEQYGNGMNVVIGAPAYGDDAGAAYVISTTDGSMVCSKTYTTANRRAGYSVVGGEFHWDMDKRGGMSSFVIGMPEYYGWDGKIDLVKESSCALVDDYFGATDNGEKFGFSMANMGYVSNLKEWFAVGSPEYSRSDIAGSDHGRVFLFREVGHSFDPWEIELLNCRYGGQSGAKYGYEVANIGNLDGDSRVDMAVGAPYHDVYWGTDVGAVFLYEVSDAGSIYSGGTIYGEEPYDHFGHSICGLGDLDGDGDDDGIAVGAPNGGDNGKVYIYMGRSTSWYVDYVGEDPGSEFGWSLAPAGDYDNDGSPDIIVGAPNFAGLGKCYVFSGASNLVIDNFAGSVGAEAFGTCVAEGGRLDDQDGGDILATDPRYDTGGEKIDAGLVYARSFVSGALWLRIGEEAYDYFGWSVSKLGDIDDDTYNEVIVGAPYNDAGGYNAGRAYVYSGLTGTLMPALTVTGDTPNGNVGISVSDGGVTGGDDTPDYLIGEPTGAAGYGRARLYSGIDGGLIHTWTGEVHLDEFGYCVYGGVDLTGDGIDDFAIGAPRNDEGGADAGKVYVYSGVDYGLYAEFVGDEPGALFGSQIGVAKHAFPYRSSSTDLLISAPGDGSSGHVYAYSVVTGELLYSEEGSEAGEGFGASLAGIGDIDNDSICDIAVGASQNDAAGEDAGMVYVIQGRLGSAPPEVVSSSPSQNELNVQADTDISVTFDSIMNSTYINSSTFVVNGRLSGRRSGAISYDEGSKTAIFDPYSDFQAGEVIQVTLTTGIESLSGRPMKSSYVWSFTVAARTATGVFLPLTGYAIGNEPNQSVCADLDGDGDVDLASCHSSDSMSVIMNDGTGSFSLDSVYLTGSLATEICAEDFDNDGFIDLLTGNYNSAEVWAYINNGNGTFAAPATYYSKNLRDVTCGDLNGDGFSDIIVSNYRAISILLNNGDGTFSARVEYPVGEGWQHSISIADLDSDGDLDFATTDTGVDSLYVFLNDGTAVFQRDFAYLTGDEPRAQTVGDFDGDGDVDIAVTSWDLNVWVYFNYGTAGFPHVTTCGTGGNAESLTAADLDGDGDLDLVSGNYSFTDIAVLLNDGTGAFVLDDTYNTSDGAVMGVVTADLNGDQRIDAVASVSGTPGETDDLCVFLNQGSYVCGDANASEAVDIDDVVHLINFIFAGGPAPDPYESGDANCSETVDIDDVVWLINYIFSGGPEPCECGP